MSVQRALPESPTPRRPATLEDWEAVPAPYTGHLIDGRLYVHPKPLPRHAWALGHLHDQLGPCNRPRGGSAPGGWILLMEVDVRLGRSVVAPDLAGWRREKMPTLPDETPVVLVPDWVCEVISPGTEVFDRSTKADWYQECGVGWLWLVDPEARTLEVYENDAGQFRQRLRFQGETAVRAPPFEEVTWPLSALWG